VPLQIPALCVIATPTNRRAIVEIAREAEQRGFPGIYVPSRHSNMSVCEALAWNTERIVFGTAIAPIYARAISDFAEAGAFMHEISGGRFQFGIGVAHAPGHARLDAKPGKPLADTRTFVERFKAQDNQGPLPPVIIAALRHKMVALAGEIGDGVIYANAARSATKQSLSAIPEAKRRDPNWFIGCMTPTCISDDIEAAKAVNRRTLTGYVQLPNYRNYWKECGYVEEMTAIEQAITEKRFDALPRLMSDKWLADVTLFGPAARVRDELAAWYETGVRTPIIVASSATGRQVQAINEVFATFTG
jgi:alkanesulfonate monooxygenase SsuD/methylene tetrahydromethanopterin reductase-like flavin-dependent oxidoreductase (luciferase family)